MKFKEVFDTCVPKAKREKERWNVFAAYIGRPISVLLTVPLIETKVKPSTITLLSIIAALIGFSMFATGEGLQYYIIGWFFFFIWNILDGVDGNLARCQRTCSPLGELWDATGGYVAMVLTYLSVSIAAFYDDNIYQLCEPHHYLIMGGLTAVLSIFPRLILHKRKNLNMSQDSVNELQDKKNFGFVQIVSMNLISVSGFMQVLFLVCILTHTLNLFICFYLVINLLTCLLSLRKLLK